MKNIYNYTLQELEDYFINNGQKKFKAIQVYDWLYKKRVSSFSEMHNVSKNVIELLRIECGVGFMKKETKIANKNDLKTPS